MKRVRDYLHDIGDEATFVSAHPYSVLVELEEGAGADELAEDAEITHRLATREVQRQAVSSREAAVFPLRAPLGILEVGRASDCQLVVDHPALSKRHAKFTVVPGGVTLEDLGSTNGTYVQGRRLSPGEVARLEPESRVSFGRAAGFQYLDPTSFFHYLALLQRFGF
ncbi:MAG: FHA domain-containing protein [Planctomycetes bacterium]|nr:FHA domain-containing protein [Planctomycetota bacterium]